MMRKIRDKAENREHVAKDGCSHYWIIEIANGPESRGVCRYCGEEREFLNTMPNYTIVKRNTRPLELPEIPEVELDKDSES